MTEEHRLEFSDPSGEKGYLVQRWGAASSTYFMIDALMPSTRWIPSERPLVPGRGIPAFAYLTMRAMKILGVRAGSIRSLVVSGNYHVESILQLEAALAAGVMLDQAIRQTRSCQSVETPMIQSLHRIAGASVHGGRRGRLSEVLEWHDGGGSAMRRAIARDRRAEHETLLRRFGMTRDHEVLYDYETRLTLTPR